ncbi:MAG TPA: Ppx/GppA phosphatase family protein [Acidimicrobiales bacterium]|nr:Ppx/GppA phosphatase family protein [Acidimicrobiales bacterium]
MTNGAVAAVDCGTNSTRLLIADRQGRTLDRRATITRLGEGVDRTHRLAPAAMARVTATLADYRRELDEHGVHDPDDVRIVATSAARDAANRDELFERIADTMGAPPELLSGDDEGRLSFRGATADLDPANGPYLVVDIGGGSTELVVGTHAPTGVTSIDVGCVRVTERFLRSDPPDAGELSDALSVVRLHLDDVTREVPQTLDAARLVGLAGSVTTVAAVELGLRTYDRDRIHHFVLTRRATEDVFRTLATERRSDRAANPGLQPERVDVIVAGALILVAVMRYFGFDECLVSESDILDGLVASILERRAP